jgi:sugar-specific transcriptional regulator TrmB
LQEILGLTKNEAKVYQTIVETSTIEPLELAKTTGLPRTRIYEVMSKLAAKGLLEKLSSGYRIIAPSDSFMNLSEQLDYDYQQKKRSIYELGAHLHNVWVKNLAANISPGVELFSYTDAESFFLEHLNNVQSRVFIAVASEVAPINHRKSGATLAKAYHDRMKVRYLIHSEKLAGTLRSLFDHFTPYTNLKIKMRANPNLHTSFVILDNIIYIYFFGSDSPLETVVLRTASPELMKSFDWIFNQLWEQGNEI